MKIKANLNEKMKVIWNSGGDWSFPSSADIYFESQNPCEVEPVISIRGGVMSCFKNAKNDALNEEARIFADTIVERWNKGVAECLTARDKAKEGKDK